MSLVLVRLGFLVAQHLLLLGVRHRRLLLGCLGHHLGLLAGPPFLGFPCLVLLAHATFSAGGAPFGRFPVGVIHDTIVRFGYLFPVDNGGIGRPVLQNGEVSRIGSRVVVDIGIDALPASLVGLGNERAFMGHPIFAIYRGILGPNVDPGFRITRDSRIQGSGVVEG
ncbi:hypothetical protein RRF57_008110 [Xylaria bambusicola]|uniref:Uncharacterized protein n=1 Tax=Xylaria bambusicola TaxID=326684 RepID=A0AAN7UNT7_9PEZI